MLPQLVGIFNFVMNSGVSEKWQHATFYEAATVLKFTLKI